MMNYADTAALMVDATFQSRTKIACLHYATYITGEATSVPAHNTRLRWANETFRLPDAAVSQIMPVLVMDDKVQTAGGAITDPDLQVAVETSINKMI